VSFAAFCSSPNPFAARPERRTFFLEQKVAKGAKEAEKEAQPKAAAPG
jgi:hypothetical protein